MNNVHITHTMVLYGWLQIIDIQKKRAEYYDSYGIDSPSHWNALKWVLLLKLANC